MMDAAFEDEQLVLVDDGDQPLGTASKRDCHLGRGRTHRAFATVVLDPEERVLLARRAAPKPLWPGYWDATVASHPRAGEGYDQASTRRLGEELGCHAESLLVDRFRYRIQYAEVGVEDELCAAVVARVESGTALAPDSHEIDAVRWVDPEELADLLTLDREPICPWMPLAIMGIGRAG
ncbi:MAG: isopentenyl-diphosphate Delta-isomerase, partial [Planctomycetota bacterium]